MTHLAPIEANPIEALVSSVLASMPTPATQRSYRFGLAHFLRWYTAQGRPPISRDLLQSYIARQVRDDAAPRSIGVRVAAVKKLVDEAAERGWIGKEEAYRISRVKSVPLRGRRLGRWLTLDQVRELMAAPDRTTLAGKRDAALFALLFGAGLRRAEAVTVTPRQIQQRQKRWLLADVKGKGGRIRSVPIVAEMRETLNEWIEAAQVGMDEPILKSFDRDTGTIITGNLTPDGVRWIVRQYSERLGVDLSAHDCRRTFAALAYLHGCPLEVISESLGHSSTAVTRVYLGGIINMEKAACDYVPSLNG
jgi:site-specific recombinase XerD